ncbi:MAG: NADH-quinone oxidoreductase subunit NuoF [Spirochaetales bacterium]|nr:NADH-quinone oxidoreductase subunit NuoF [Spirochaetales bacterium]
MIKTNKDLLQYYNKITKESSKNDLEIIVSMGTCGIAAGTTPVLDELKKGIQEKGLSNKVTITESGCMGLCHSEPSIEVIDHKASKSIVYGDVKPEHALDILSNGVNPINGPTLINRTWYYPEDESKKENCPQARVVLRNTGRINPESIEQYIMQKGYQALGKTLCEMSPDDVVKSIMDSGLRGRGGGGFPTGKKWSLAKAVSADQKYVLCNADEGDPGAFMDRAVLEGDPHAVIEAMAIAGYAIGATKGGIYIRAEYPLAIKRLQIALNQAREMGFLGKNIFGSAFDFDIEIKYGAGAFVCGEETALIHSIEGMRGEPSFKPPFPAVAGLWAKPTIVNNVETYANIPAIIRKGADWFKTIGTPNSPGTKVFALAGKIKKVGLVEVPMGTTLGDMIFKIGEGIRNDREFKAVQTGGPSGGCITAKSIDTPIDYDSLRALGSMMGSGGMIVMDEDDCMVNIAKYFLEFTLDESCGKCTPCRIGNTRLYEMLDDITKGRGTQQTLFKLRDLAHVIKDTSLCGLGQSSPNPVLSTLANFIDEYEVHIYEKKCPAGVCRELIQYTIEADKCTGCTLCARNCPVSCISGERKQPHVIDQSKCIKCGVCYEACKFHAITKN